MTDGKHDTGVPTYDPPIQLSKYQFTPPTEWLWHHRFARRHINVLEADGGVGKTLMCCDLAARLSRGLELPGDPERKSSARPQRTLIVTAEDEGRELYNRVLAAQGDPSMIWLKDEPVFLPGDAEVLEKWVHDYQISFLVIDPITSFFESWVNIYKDTDVRQALGPLKSLARRMNLTVVLIRHLIKSGMGPASARGAGSAAFKNFSRNCFQVVPHNGGHAVGRVKGNLCRCPTSLPFTVEESEPIRLSEAEIVQRLKDVFARLDVLKTGELTHEQKIEWDELTAEVLALNDQDSPPADNEPPPKIVWGVPIQGSAEDLLAQSLGAEKDTLDVACAAFIERTIVNNGTMLSNAIKDMAEQKGWSGGTFKRAQAILKDKGIASFQKSGQWHMGYKDPFET